MTVTVALSEVDALACFAGLGFNTNITIDSLPLRWVARPPSVKWIVVSEPLVCEFCEDGDLYGIDDDHVMDCPDCTDGLPDVQIVSDQQINGRPMMEPEINGVVAIGTAVPIRSQHPTAPMFAEYLLALGHCVQDWTKALGSDITDQFGTQAVTPGRYAHPILSSPDGTDAATTAA